MDLIIKNLERLKDYSNSNHKPIERVVVDFDKLATEDFTQLFFNACEKYNDESEGDCSLCSKCKHQFVQGYEEPCKSCLKSKEISPNWEPKEPNLKELYKKYVEVEDIKKAMEPEKTCRTCKYYALKVYEEPCQKCIESCLAQDEMNLNWEPTLKEATERMQSEFDATGKDVKIFMNERIIKE